MFSIKKRIVFVSLFIFSGPCSVLIGASELPPGLDQNMSDAEDQFADFSGGQDMSLDTESVFTESRTSSPSDMSIDSRNSTPAERMLAGLNGRKSPFIQFDRSLATEDQERAGTADPRNIFPEQSIEVADASEDSGDESEYSGDESDEDSRAVGRNRKRQDEDSCYASEDNRDASEDSGNESEEDLYYHCAHPGCDYTGVHQGALDKIRYMIF